MRHDLLTFDCYGTLVDWRGGIARAFREAAPPNAEAPAGEVLRLHALHEPRVQAEGFRSYREVLAETARRIAADLGWGERLAEPGFLAASLPGWPLFPDTVPALERLRDAGYALGILSNVDDDLLAATRRRLGVDFELVVTAQAVGSYKPAPGHFIAARRALAGRRWLHVAQSLFHDVVPATELGIESAWVNRLEEPLPDGLAPRRVVRDLADLADWLAPGSRRPGDAAGA